MDIHSWLLLGFGFICGLLTGLCYLLSSERSKKL